MPPKGHVLGMSVSGMVTVAVLMTPEQPAIKDVKPCLAATPSNTDKAIVVGADKDVTSTLSQAQVKLACNLRFLPSKVGMTASTRAFTLLLTSIKCIRSWTMLGASCY